MRIEIDLNGQKFASDLSQGHDISIPLSPNGPRAWYVDPMEIKPVMNEFFTGSVALGGGVNFRNVYFNPHGHGTHTETVGHIDKEVVSINKTLNQFFFKAELITVEPEIYSGPDEEFKKIGDRIITRQQLEKAFARNDVEALIVRTLPNTDEKLTKNYSDTNFPYFEPAALTYVRECGIKHFLTDLPSVDRELDGGKLLSHRAFWWGKRPDNLECTISEMVYARPEVADGVYLLNIQIAPLENDASPSKPVLYPLIAL